jgi:hypothetical protein
MQVEFIMVRGLRIRLRMEIRPLVMALLLRGVLRALLMDYRHALWLVKEEVTLYALRSLRHDGVRLSELLCQISSI